MAEVQQAKKTVTDGKHREKTTLPLQSVSERVVVENNFLGKALVEGCAIAAPCRSKVAEQLLEIGVKAGITGIVAKEIADKISAEELDHLITLEMTGNDDITNKYLGLLEGKYGPSNTGGDQIADSGPTNTGGNQIATGNVPTHTGNNQASGQGTTNTGNTEGVPNTGGNTTVTPSPEGPNKDDFIYMSDGHMLGANGVKVLSKTIWKGEGKERIDVENPNPGQRPGQVHYQDNKNNKYYYNPNSNDFYSFDASKNKIPAPSSVNKLLEDPKFKQAIDKCMKQYLGGE